MKERDREREINMKEKQKKHKMRVWKKEYDENEGIIQFSCHEIFEAKVVKDKREPRREKREK